MSCVTCKFNESGKCVNDCFQIHFKYNPLDPNHQNRLPLTIHKSEVAFIEVNEKFLTVVDMDGIQHNYNLDTISHYHVPDFCKINPGIADCQ